MSTILVDNLTGKTTAGSITVTSEGGAATQSLQQGLAKAFCKNSMSDNTIADSLNVSSMTDQATGQATIALANSMGSSTDYVAASGSAGGGTTLGSGYSGSCYPQNASSYWVIGFWGTTTYDLPHMGSTMHGDLA